MGLIIKGVPFQGAPTIFSMNVASEWHSACLALRKEGTKGRICCVFLGGEKMGFFRIIKMAWLLENKCILWDGLRT